MMTGSENRGEKQQGATPDWTWSRRDRSSSHYAYPRPGGLLRGRCRYTLQCDAPAVNLFVYSALRKNRLARLSQPVPTSVSSRAFAGLRLFLRLFAMVLSITAPQLRHFHA